jgi:PAS domain S-box-containing protein
MAKPLIAILQRQLPVVTLIAGLLFTAVAVKIAGDLRTKDERRHFERLAERVVQAIEIRIDTHTRILHGIRGLFAADVQPSRTQFTLFAGEVSTVSSPGSLGYGFIRYLTAKQLPAFIEARRSELGPDFKIRRPGSDQAHFIVDFIVPEAANQAAIGFDLSSERYRTEALVAAVERNQATLTRRIALVQDDEERAAFLLALPIFHANAKLAEAPAARWQQLTGWAYAPLRIDRLLNGIAEETDGMVDFELFEEAPFIAANLLYDTDDHVANLGGVIDYQQAYGKRRHERLIAMNVAGQQWFAQVTSNRLFERLPRSQAPLIILFGGIVTSFLLAGLFASLRRTTDKAEALAAKMTDSLRSSEQEAREMLVQLEQLKLAIDAHAIVAITDTQGTINYVNQRFCDISGYSEAELIGQNHRLLRSKVHDDAFFRDMYRTIASGKTWHGEICNRSKSGSLYWVDSTIVPIINASGKPVFYLAIRTDISALKAAMSELEVHQKHLQDLVHAQTANLLEARDAAEAASRAKTEFISNMSHELRTPMHGVIALSELGLKRAPSMPMEKIVDYFIRIRDAGQRMMVLVSQVLDFSRLDAKQMAFHPQATDLAILARNVVQDLTAQADSCQQQLVIAEPDFPPVAMVDGTRITQVLRILIINAMKYSPSATRIDISFTATTLPGKDGEQAAIEVAVRDQGVGIPPDELESIFEHFVQSSATRTGAGGTGLGLAISRRIIEAHGGTIAASNNANGGACVRFCLPITTLPATH